MEHKIVNSPAFHIVGIEVRTTNENGQSRQDISSLWKRFYSENIQELVPNKLSDEIVTLYTDYESDFTKPYSVVIGFKVNTLDTISSGLVGKSIPEQKNALFTVRGKLPDELINTWKFIWGSDLQRAYTSDFEVYGSKAKDRENAEMEVYVAIR